MRNGLVWIAMLALLASCEGTLTTELDGQGVDSVANDVAVPTDAASIASGAELYGLYCQTCHGPDAAGAVTWPSPIQGYEPIREIVNNGRGDMGAVPIDNEEVLLIQAYLSSFGKPDWSALTGPEVFATGCASCHGAEAEGTARGPQLRFRDDEYFDYVTRNGGWADRFGSPMEAFGDDRVSDAQLAEMTAWIDDFPNAETGEGLFHQFCANCHGDSTVRARINDEVDEESIFGVSRQGKEDSVRNRNYMPGWSSSVLPDSDLQAIQDFINSK